MDEYRVDIKIKAAYGGEIPDKRVYVSADTPHKAARKAESKLRRIYPDSYTYDITVENVEFIAHQFSFELE